MKGIRPRLVGTILVAGWALTAWISMTSGTLLNWPDFVHLDYGFPLTFAVHTLNTIAGPVDKWSVDPSALSADLSFWFLGLAIISVGSIYYVDRAVRTREGEAPSQRSERHK